MLSPLSDIAITSQYLATLTGSMVHTNVRLMTSLVELDIDISGMRSVTRVCAGIKCENNNTHKQVTVTAYKYTIKCGC